MRVLQWESDAGACTAQRGFVDAHVAAMPADHVARDGEAEAHAAGLDIARRIETEKRLEDVFARFRRDSRTVVVDDDLDLA